MPNGYGFGFRGASPPWPYIGLGRGGLPRCWYPLSFMSPAYWQAGQPVPYPYYGRTPSMIPSYPAPFAGAYGAPGMPSAPPMTREQELSFLRGQAEAIKEQLDDIEARIKELEAE